MHDYEIRFLENVKPKLTGGRRAIIDETFKDNAQFSDRMSAEDIEGSI
jgi:hypothetical protein